MPLRPFSPTGLLVCTLLAAPSLGQQRHEQQPDEPLRATLRGRVVDMFGSPLAGAEVVHDDPATPADARQGATTDEHGRFELRDVSRRRAWRIQAHRPGMAVGSVLQLHERRAMQIVLLDAVVTHGILRNRLGQPVAGAIVRGITFLTDVHEQQVTTAADGSFVLDRLPPGPTSIVAHVPGEGLYMQNGYLRENGPATLRPCGVAPVDLTLQFTGLTPEHLADAVVHMSPNGGFPGLPPSWNAVPLDDDGTCHLRELPNVPFEVRLCSRSQRFTMVRRELDARRGATDHVFRIDADELRSADALDAYGIALGAAPELPKLGPDWIFAAADDEALANVPVPAVVAATDGAPTTTDTALTGRVVGRDGRPAAGIAVELRPVTWDTLLGRAFAATVTDEQGTYRFSDVPNSTHPVVVVAGPQGGWAQGLPLDVSHSAAGIEAGELHLVEPGRVFGVVRDAAGRPACGVRVQLTSMPDSHGSTSTDEVVSNAGGEFCFLDVAPGRARLLAFADEGPARAELGQLFDVPSGRTVMRDVTRR